MSIETRLRSTGEEGGAGGGGSGTVNTGSAGYLAYYPSSSASVSPSAISTSTGSGVAPLNFQALTLQIVSPTTGDFWVLNSAGVSIYSYVNNTAFYTILSHTGGLINTANFATTGLTYVFSSFVAGYPSALYIRPGSSATTHITGSNLFINAITSASASSSGLAGKDAVYVLSSFNAEYTNAVYIRPGSSVTTHITGSNLFINATTSAGGAAGDNAFQLLPQQAKLYANDSAARIDAGTAWWRLLFSSTTQQYGVWQFMVPPDYGSNPYVRLAWAAN